MRIIRYLTSGVVGVSVNLGLYRLLVEYAVTGKIAGSIIAVTCSTVVGFCMQKYWTFGERNLERTHTQFALYALLAGTNICLSTMIVFVLIAFFNIYYLLAQTIAAAVLAGVSFFLYRDLIFKASDNALSMRV
jgi:putative flippase GtrA